MEPPTTRLFSTARIVALALIALALAGLAYLRFSSGSSEVSVPQGAHAGQLTLHPCTYADEAGELRRRLRHAGRAREPARLALAADRAAGHAHQGALGASRRAGLPPAGRARPYQHGLPRREPLRRRPRRRPRRLPRRRRLLGARLPRGRVGDEALPRPARKGLLRRVRDASVRAAPSASRRRRRPRRLLAAGARRRSRGRASRARLPPHRPAQRERGHPNGPDLRLAIPEEHPPLGDDRRQPAGQLPLVPADHRRAGPQVRRALHARTTLAARARTTSPRRSAAPRGRSRTAGASCASSPATRRSAPSSACSTPRARPRRSPARRHRHVAVRLQGRCERAVAAVGDGPARLPRGAGEGRRCRGRAHGRLVRPALLCGAARARLDPGRPGDRLPLGWRPAPRRLAGQPRRERVLARARLERARRC